MPGETLKQRREVLGLAVQDTAPMIGLPLEQVIALEAGRSVCLAGGNFEVDHLMKFYAKNQSDVDALFYAYSIVDQEPGEIR